MKKNWLRLTIGAIAIVGLAANLLIHVYPISWGGKGNAGLRQPEVLPGPALQEWKQIWSANLPRPELIAPAAAVPPTTPEIVPAALRSSVDASPVEAKLEQIVRNLEQIEKRIERMEARLARQFPTLPEEPVADVITPARKIVTQARSASAGMQHPWCEAVPALALRACVLLSCRRNISPPASDNAVQVGPVPFVTPNAGRDSERYCKTIRVPMFQNRTCYRGMETQLTEEIIRQIEQKSPYKVVEGDADLELMGKILNVKKNVDLENPSAGVRDMTVTVEVVFKDLHTGELLFKEPKHPNVASMLAAASGGVDAKESAIWEYRNNDAHNPQTKVVPSSEELPKPTAGGIILRNAGNYIPELGQSITTAEQKAINAVAVQVVNALEKPW